MSLHLIKLSRIALGKWFCSILFAWGDIQGILSSLFNNLVPSFYLYYCYVLGIIVLSISTYFTMEPQVIFYPGEFVKYHLPCGTSRVGRIHNVTNQMIILLA